MTLQSILIQAELFRNYMNGLSTLKTTLIVVVLSIVVYLFIAFCFLFLGVFDSKKYEKFQEMMLPFLMLWEITSGVVREIKKLIKKR